MLARFALCFVFGLAFSLSIVKADTPSSATQPATTQPIATAEVISVQITRPVSPDVNKALSILRRGSYNSSDRSPGVVELGLVVKVPDRMILSAGEDALQVTTFVDEKFNELGHARRDSHGYYNNGSTSVNVANEGHAAVFLVTSERAPSPDASRVLFRGVVTLRTIAGQKTSERQKLSLRVGKILTVGPIPMTIRALSSLNKGLNVSLSADESIELIRAIRFYDSNGKKIASPSRQDGSMQSGRGQSSITLTLPDTLDDVDVEVDYAERAESVTLPIEAQADVGLAAVGQAVSAPATDPPKETSRSKTSSRTRVSSSSRTPSNQEQSHLVPLAVATPMTLPATRPVWPDRTADDFPASRLRIEWPITQPSLAIATTRAAFPNIDAAEAPKPAGPAIQFQTDLLSLFIGKMPPEAAKWSTRSEYLFRPDGGTVLRLLLSMPDHTVMNVDSTTLKIDQFVDDAGRTLSTAIDPNGLARSTTPSAPHRVLISKDGHHAVFPVMLTDIPSPKATRFMLHGSVVVQVGFNERTAEQKNFSFTVGSKIDLGDSALTISSLSSGSTNVPSEELPFIVHFRTTQSPETIRSIEVVDDAGQVVPATLFKSFNSSENSNSGSTRTLQCTLGRDVARGTIKVTYLDRIDSKRVPIHVLSGIGI